ncbi:MAG: lipopolysaccharide biosynthesis protein, partial [Prevotellaceae bacterium]|nr:lipopolysaccharide biosynthesis protein [Prevotellaceae bacterium]
KKLAYINNVNADYVHQRVDYYNRLNDCHCGLDPQSPVPVCHSDESQNPLCFQGIAGQARNDVSIQDFKKNCKKNVYFFDTYEYLCYFPKTLKFIPLFGDIIHIPALPSLTKSRPIAGDNANSVLLKLDKIRHFLFLKDKNRFEDKKNMLVSRGKAHGDHRIRFLEMYINHPLCNIGQVNRNKNPQFIRPRLTISEHLKYKFILCLEGNDVASNLKWVMSSNSIAVMPRPKYETWFMEGTLKPDYHYILIKDDYSDLEERLHYYIEHTNEALQIIENAHQYIAQFRAKRQEDLISLLVLKKYFEKTGQL